MAIILTKSAAITKSKLKNGFNGDNFNLNGRVVPSDEADRGYKAAGDVKPPFTALLASGSSQGFATGAVAAFNDYRADINKNRYDAQPVFDRYFNDMASVVEKCNIPSASLSLSGVCIFDDCVLAARSGGCHILRFSQGELYEIALAEDENARGFQVVDVVYNGDIFVIVNQEASADLDYDAIVNILDSGNDVKIMIKDLYKSLSSHSKNDCSAIVIKVESDTEETHSAMPIITHKKEASDDEFHYADPVDAPVDDNQETEIEAEDDLAAGKNNSAKKSFLKTIPIILLVIILAVAAALYFATRPKKPNYEDTTEPVLVTVEVEVEESESEMDLNGSNGMQDVEDEGPEIEETTTKRREPATASPTRAPSTNAPSTTAPDETTASAGETTASSGETTAQSEVPTTASSASTTQANEEQGEPQAGE